MKKLITGTLILLGGSLLSCAEIINIYDSEFIGIAGSTSSVTNYGWKIISSGSTFYGDADLSVKQSLFVKDAVIGYEFDDSYSFSVHGDVGAAYQVDELWIHTKLMCGGVSGDTVKFRMAFGNSSYEESFYGKTAGIHLETYNKESPYAKVAALCHGYTTPSADCIYDYPYDYGDSGTYMDAYIKITDSGSAMLAEIWLDPADPENLGEASVIKTQLYKDGFSNIIDQVEINTWAVSGAPSYSRIASLEIWAVFSEDPYSDWMAPYAGSLSAAEQERTADPDGDSVNNLMEYALGGNPTNTDASTVLPSLYIDAGDAVYLYNRRTNYAGLGLSYRLELTSDLVSGIFSNDPSAYVENVSMPSNGFEMVTNRISTAEAAKFFTLTVEEE